MGKCISAYTKLDPTYPGYINLTREDDGRVSIYVRGDPLKRSGSFICGNASDKGQPGRCTPGDDRCNNYCNAAPEKGPMRAAPAACEHIVCGETVKLSLSAPEFDALLAELKA